MGFTRYITYLKLALCWFIAFSIVSCSAQGIKSKKKATEQLSGENKSERDKEEDRGTTQGEQSSYNEDTKDVSYSIKDEYRAEIYTEENRYFTTKESIYEYVSTLEYEIGLKYKFPLRYTPPTIQQLLNVKDSVGTEAVELLTEQTRIYYLFDHSKELLIQVSKLQHMSGMIFCSEDYKSNTKYLKMFGVDWLRLQYQDSLIVNDKLKSLSILTESIKSSYGYFHLEYKTLNENPLIKSLKNYEFQGSIKEQKKYFNDVIDLHNSNMQKLIEQAEAFTDKTYTSFNDIYEVLNLRFPKYRQYITP
jgi:hypothetical protein